MNAAEMVESVELDVYPGAAAAMTEAGRGWLGRELAHQAARHAVTAWAMAVNGDRTELAAIADPDRVEWLLYPDSYTPRLRQWGRPCRPNASGGAAAARATGGRH